MSGPVTLTIDGLHLIVVATPLDGEVFAPFGQVIQNPRPGLDVLAASQHQLPLKPGAVYANQGSAVKYSHVSHMPNLYDQAPSQQPGIAVMSMFVCAARQLEAEPVHPHALSDGGIFRVGVLERHPFTSQTFIPLTAQRRRYLVVVAPSMPPAAADEGLPVPASPPMPGRGLPDLRRLCAFVATSGQAVSYGPGTWHAPMVALGDQGSTVDFVVVQFANQVAIEDCQEAFLTSGGEMAPALESTDARNKLEDLSGVVVEPGGNPYQALIAACHDDPAEIESLYSAHRTTRNAQQRDKFLAPDFKELIIDPFLLRLEDKTVEPGFQDPRNCLVFWARPPDHILKLAIHLQQKLRSVAPSLWLMPSYRMHMTTLEVTHSRTSAEVDMLVSQMRPILGALTNFTYTHRTRLARPMLSYDLAAVAVSFLPVAGGGGGGGGTLQAQAGAGGASEHLDTYTYHHLRRDVFDLAGTTGVEIGSRYVVPSAHITLARFLTQDDHATAGMREAWVRAIQDINDWLEAEVWGHREGECGFDGEWVVGQEKGLDARQGTLWYGGGRTIIVGEGF
ncbi:hypothetical protein GQ53DRAFT_789770 [Thozetella sp. PMI_491]|nr:hypothetical protein GQ53DRAFT_789770 [Thozetella sp. PMI_491]